MHSKLLLSICIDNRVKDILFDMCDNRNDHTISDQMICLIVF